MYVCMHACMYVCKSLIQNTPNLDITCLFDRIYNILIAFVIFVYLFAVVHCSNLCILNL